jgi:hypothetical protein
MYPIGRKGGANEYQPVEPHNRNYYGHSFQIAKHCFGTVRCSPGGCDSLREPSEPKTPIRKLDTLN